MFKTLFATLLLSTSLATPSLKADVIQPKDAYNSFNQVYGAYNYKTDFEDLFEVYNKYGTFDEVLYFYDGSGDTQYLYYATLNFNNSNMPYDLYLNSIEFNLFSGTFAPTLTITYSMFDIYLQDRTYSVSFDGVDLYTDLIYPGVIFNVLDSYYINGRLADVFNAVFTKDDNELTTTYNGYFNFVTNNTLVENKIYVAGSVLFDGSIYYQMSNYQNSDGLRFYYYSQDLGVYTSSLFGYPFSQNEVVQSSNILINGKMANSTYSYLSSVGTFSYVRHDIGDGTFKDLLFSVMDSPIYLITQLLSFELFGINMFVALTGLLTIVVILVLIRKFW